MLRVLKAHWFTIVVATCTILTTVADLITDVLDMGFGWRILEMLIGE